MNYAIKIIRDEEVGVFVTSDDVMGLVLESASIDVLIKRVKNAVPELISLNNLPTQEPITLTFNIQCQL